MVQCKNCHADISEKYCANCGQPALVKKINAHYISHEIQHLLHFEKGILFTIKELLLRPGQCIREFVAENRNKLIKPIPFLIFTSLLYTLVAHYFHVEEAYAKDTEKLYGHSAVGNIQQWVQTHYGYANIIMGGFIALWVKIFFKKSAYNIFEITILLCFLMGMGMLQLAVAALISGLLHLSVVYFLVMLVAILYICWGIGQFFGAKKAMNYVKAVLAYVIGYFSFEIVITVIGITADHFSK